MNTITAIILTAVLSSALTLLITFLFAKQFLVPKLKLWIEETLLPEFRSQVKNGAIDSGDVLLPKFRDNVREGFNDAVRDQVGGQAFEEAAKTVTKKMEAGLGALLGRKPD